MGSMGVPDDQGGPVGGYPSSAADGIGNGSGSGNGEFQVKRKGLRNRLWKGKEEVR